MKAIIQTTLNQAQLTDIQEPNKTNNLVIDLFGSAINQQLFRRISQGDEVISVAQKDTTGIHFISKPAFLTLTFSN